MATVLPGSTFILTFFKSSLSGLYEKYKLLISTLPLTFSSSVASALSGNSGASSINSNTRAAQAIAFWSSVTTELISLKGFVYWLAYDKKQERMPTVILPFTAIIAPKRATAA